MSATPANREAAWAAAHRLREDGRIEAATAAVVSLWENAPTDRTFALAALGFLKECGAYDRALPIARSARRQWPADARFAAYAGELALALGEFEEAAAALRIAIDLDPAQGPAWLRLAHCKRYTQNDGPDLQRFRHGWADATLDILTRTCIGFALGKALDDLGDVAQAAQVLTEANAAARESANWRIRDWHDVVEARLHAAPLEADDHFAPIFVVGLPRSGTTLVAAALGRHADVRDRGELDWIPALHALLHEQDRLHDRRALAAIATVIRAQMRRDDAPARFYLDKNPLNFRHLDFIAACFPNARIVYCRRTARDTALSIWMQHFAHADLGFAYDFRAIAAVQNDCAALMAHWRSRLALATIEVDYEDFVADPARQRQRLAAFLGLPDLGEGEPAMERPQVVTTASVWQVRQPVYAHAVERWRRYAPYLPELTTLFAP
jgi:tetratricopeptide (TPR) repeat protein